MLKSNKNNKSDENLIHKKKIEKDGCYFFVAGGANEIGMNLNMFCIKNNGEEQWIIVDAGISIQRSDGINSVMCSFNEVINKNIIGIVCTHAHDDHIGALPFLLPRLRQSTPVYATSFTIQMINKKLVEHKVERFADLITVPINSRFTIGNFGIEMIYITHSIPEPNAIAITFNPFNYKILHTGDWKFDNDPIVGPLTEMNRLKELGKHGIDAIVCDSTNASEEVRTPSEAVARVNLEKLIKELHGKKIFVSCFASNVARVASLIDIAAANNRKVVLLGRSIEFVSALAQKEGYLKYCHNLVKPAEAKHIADSKLMIICTGSQGEKGSVLQKLANEGYFNPLNINKDDVVVFSSRVIPGNDGPIMDIKNKLIRRGVRIIDLKHSEIHVSGHPSAVELREMFSMVKPKCVIPVHGDAYHLQAAQEVALSVGIKNTLIPFNGALIDLLNGPSIIARIEMSKCGTDGYQLVGLDSNMLVTRKQMGENGAIFLVLTKDNNLRSIYTYGVLPNRIISDQKYIRFIRSIIEDCKENNILDISSVVRDSILKKFKKNPIIVTHIL